MNILRTVNQIMSIASKAHYLNGGNASKVLAKDKKGIFTIEQVSETLQCNPVELKQLLQQNGIMCGDYVINEAWGDGKKLSTFALRTLSNKVTKSNNQQQQYGQHAPTWAKIVTFLFIASVALFIIGYPLLAIVTLLLMIGVVFKPACKQFKEKHPELMNKQIVITIFTILKVIGYVFIVGLSGILVGGQLNYYPVTFGIWVVGVLIPKTWTAAIGINDHLYHEGALYMGAVAGIILIVGFLLLMKRRFTVPAMKVNTSGLDKWLYLFLTLAIFSGMAGTLLNASGFFDYRVSIGPWFRSLLSFMPDPSLMEGVPFMFKFHMLAWMVVAIIFPFSRLVHCLSVPLNYLTRPFIVYRKRDEK